MNHRLYLSVLSLMLCCTSALAACINDNEDGLSDIDIVKVGMTLPEFSVELSDGTKFSPDSCDKPTVIVFFHTECPDCQRELPVVQKMYDDYTGRGIRFVCISREQEQSEVADYWQREALSLPYCATGDRTVYDLFARNTIPRVYVSSAEDIVTAAFVEKVSERKLRRAIERMLK